MNIFEMTIEDFKNVKRREGWAGNVPEFKSLVILPMGDLHDSGYMMMDFIAVNANNEPIMRISGCSDVLHINGIGGYGKWGFDIEIPSYIKPIDWSIDCLPCGLLRLFTRNSMTCGNIVSDFEVFTEVERL